MKAKYPEFSAERGVCGKKFEISYRELAHAQMEKNRERINK